MEQIWEIPPVTRTFLLGYISEAVLLRLNILHEVDMFFSWEHVFQKGQYRRLLYSIFYLGNFPLASTIITIYIFVQRLREMEDSIPDKKRLVMKLFSLYFGVLMLSKYIALITPLTMALITNIGYYNSKKNYSTPIVLAPQLEVDVVWIPLMVLASFIYLDDNRSISELLPYFLPAHVLHYLDDTLYKTYGLST